MTAAVCPKMRHLSFVEHGLVVPCRGVWGAIKVVEFSWGITAKSRGQYSTRLMGTNVLKMVAYQIESDLVELVRPHYKRVEDEGRTFIQMALQNTADIEPTDNRLLITLTPLSSPHRSRALEALCEMLNKIKQTRCSRALRFKRLIR
jgi:hypothetical protein